MATVAKKICDECNTDENVDEVVIVKKWGKTAPFGVDLCQGCYDRMLAPLEKRGHPVKQSNVRPPTRLKETILTPAQLGE